MRTVQNMTARYICSLRIQLRAYYNIIANYSMSTPIQNKSNNVPYKIMVLALKKTSSA